MASLAATTAERKRGCASLEGHTDVVKLLIEKGAEVNTKGRWGTTPLHYASLEGHTDMVKWLIEKGVEVNAKAGAQQVKTLRPSVCLFKRALHVVNRAAVTVPPRTRHDRIHV